MAGIDVTRFGGVNLTASPRAIDNGQATAATGVVLDEDGSVRQICMQGAQVTTGLGTGTTLANSDSKTVFPYVVSSTRYWLEWAGDVDVARSPVDTDTYQRLYFTGDGVPKMTFNSIFATGTGKYPRSSRPLGILAPAAKPTVSATLPETVVAGAITSVTVSSLKMIHEVAGSDGRNSGNGQALVNATITPTALLTLPVGTRLKVASIVDANSVTVTGVSDIGYACIVEKRDYGLEWANGDNLWRRRKKAYWNFLIPGGATLAIANHGLQVGDVIQVTAVSAPMAWEFAQLTTTPTTDQYARTATKVAGGNIAFSGNCSFIIDRGGATIDPTVPQQNYVIESRAYVYTYVSDLGEEGPPSPPSDIVNVVVGDPVTVGGFTAPPVDGRVITHRRIYRTNTGSETTEFQFVTEIPLATTQYVDTLDPSALGEVLPSETWEPPPSGLKGIVMLPNGAACGFDGKTLCFAEPGYPHAWPPEYRYTVDFDIVGIQVYGTSVLVATKGVPFVATGAHPRQMSVRRVTDQAHGCLSKRTVVSTPYGVVYTTPDGIVLVNENGVRNITESVLPPGKWKVLMGLTSASSSGTYGPYEMFCVWHQHTLYLFMRYEPAPTDFAALSFRFAGDRVDYVVIGSSYPTADIPGAGGGGGMNRFATAAYVDPTTGQFFYVDGSFLFSRYEDTNLPASEYPGSWVSKVFTFANPVNLAYALVTFRAPALSGTDCWGRLKVSYLDSAGNTVSTAETTLTFVDTRSTAVVRVSDVMRLPPAVQSDSVQFTLLLQGPVVVERVQLVQHVDEIE